MTAPASLAGRWWLAIRPKTLTIAVAPVVAGTALALAEGTSPRPLAALAAGFMPMLVSLPLAIVGLGTAGAAVLQFRSSRRQLLVFATRYASVPLVEMLAAQPAQEQVATFIADLVRDIDNLIHDKELSADALRAGELRSLRKLVERKIIDLPSYESAKQQLLTMAL